MDEDSALKIGDYRLSGKNLIVIGLIIVGAFFAYVLFIRPKPATTTAATSTDTSGGSSGGDSSDASALGSLEASIQSLQQGEAAQNAQLTTIGKNADSAARDAAGARTDASVALNGVNQLLSRGNTSVTTGKTATTTVPASQTKTVGATGAATTNTVTTKPPVTGKGSSYGSDAWHITAAGLGLN